MNRSSHRTPRTATRPVLPLLVLLALSAPTPAAAQTAPPASDGASWGLYDAIGYGGLGFGVSLLAASGMEGQGFGPPTGALVVVGAGTVVGIVTGAVIGRAASRAVARGRPVGAGHRAAALGGVFLVGSTVGALAAIPLINGEGEDTPLGSDERTAAFTILGGSALGALAAWRMADDFSPALVEVAPTVGREGYGLQVRLEM